MARRAIYRVRDERFSTLGAREKPFGDVGGFAGDSVAALVLLAHRARDDFASGDTDVRRKRRRQAQAQFQKRVLNFKRGADRPFRVIAMRDRGAEQRHRCIADMFVDRSAETLDDDRIDEAEKAIQQPVNVFRLQLRRQVHIPHDIAEENSDRATLPLGNRWTRRFR